MKIYNLFISGGDGCTYSCEDFIGSFSTLKLAEDCKLKILLFSQLFYELTEERNNIYAYDVIKKAKEYNIELEYIGRNDIKQKLDSFYYSTSFKIKDSIYLCHSCFNVNENDLMIKETELYE